MKDLAEGQKEDPTQSNESYLGMDSVELFDYYDKLLKLNDSLNEFKAQKNPFSYIYRQFDKISHYMGEVLTNFTNIGFNLLIESVDDDIKEAQTHVTNINYGEDPTHTQLGKDALNNPLNGLASELAEIAVKDIGKRMKDIWEGKVNDPNGDNLIHYVMNTYSRHPRNVDWMDEKIINWVDDNNEVLKDLYYPTFTAHAHDIAKRNVSLAERTIRKIKKYFSK